MSDLAFDKEFAGSMKYGINNNVHNVRANHVDNRDDNGIAVYRTVDGIHDFETPMKGRTANTLLRTQYGIGNNDNPRDFLKIINGIEPPAVNNKTTANKNNLHQNLD